MAAHSQIDFLGEKEEKRIVLPEWWVEGGEGQGEGWGGGNVKYCHTVSTEHIEKTTYSYLA